MITRTQALDALRQVVDPDVGVNIVDLGLVELVSTDADGVRVALVMTSPAYPQSRYLRAESILVLERAGAAMATVEVLNAPLWSPDRLSPAAKQILGW